MILDTKSNQHPREELVKNSSKERPQCQNEWGHGYMVKDDTVQLSICEFIVTSNNGNGSAIFYPSGAFLNKKYVVSAEIIGHANEVVY